MIRVLVKIELICKYKLKITCDFNAQTSKVYSSLMPCNI